MLYVFQLYVAELENAEEKRVDFNQLSRLKLKLEMLGIDYGICMPGQYNHLICPIVR